MNQEPMGPHPSSFKSKQDRVVITGMGTITALGHSVKETWENLAGGQSGIDYITLFDHRRLPVHIAAEVKDFDPDPYMPRKDAKRMARCSLLAIAAATEAMADAGLAYPLTGAMAEKTGVVLGTGMGGFDKVEEGMKDYFDRGLGRVSPFSLPAALPNLSSFHLCVRFNVQGYTNTTATACSAGNVAIAEAAEVIKQGRCDVMISGGAEATVLETALASFIAMRALSSNADPGQASRPFDANRDGFVIGEGSAIFILERLDHALNRNARIYAEVLGSAQSSDTYHLAVPDPGARGAIQAMKWALEDAAVPPNEIDYINAHGPSTPLGDAAETRAIKSLFGDRASAIPVSSTKSMIGHAFGAAGAIEAMACIKTIETGLIHPTINYDTPDPECDLDYVPNQARRRPVHIALSNSFGLGGQNSCLVFGKYEE